MGKNNVHKNIKIYCIFLRITNLRKIKIKILFLILLRIDKNHTFFLEMPQTVQKMAKHYLIIISEYLNAAGIHLQVVIPLLHL